MEPLRESLRRATAMLKACSDPRREAGEGKEKAIEKVENELSRLGDTLTGRANGNGVFSKEKNAEEKIQRFLIIPPEEMKRISNVFDLYIYIAATPLLSPGVPPLPIRNRETGTVSITKKHHLKIKSLLERRMKLLLGVLLGSPSSSSVSASFSHPQLQKLTCDRYLAHVWAILLELYHTQGNDSKNKIREWMNLLAVLSARGSMEALFTLHAPTRATETYFDPYERPKWLRNLCRKYLSLLLMESGGITTLATVLIQGEKDRSLIPKLVTYVARAVASPSPLLAEEKIPLRMYMSKVAAQLTKALRTPPSPRLLSGVISAHVETIFMLNVKRPRLTNELVMKAGMFGIQQGEALGVIFAWRLATAGVKILTSARSRLLWPYAHHLLEVAAGCSSDNDDHQSLKNLQNLGLKALIALLTSEINPNEAMKLINKMLSSSPASQDEILCKTLAQALALAREGVSGEVYAGLLRMFPGSVHKRSCTVRLGVYGSAILAHWKSTRLKNQSMMSFTKFIGGGSTLGAVEYILKILLEKKMDGDIETVWTKLCVEILELFDPVQATSSEGAVLASVIPLLQKCLKNMPLELSKKKAPKPIQIHQISEVKDIYEKWGIEECLEKLAKEKLVTIRARALLTLEKHVQKEKKIEKYFPKIVPEANKGLCSEESFIYQPATALLAALAVRVPSKMLSVLMKHFTTNELLIDIRLKIGEVITETFQRLHDKKLFLTTSEVILPLIRTFEEEQTMPLVRVSALSALGEALFVVADNAIGKQADTLINVVVTCGKLERLESKENGGVEVRRAALYFIEKLVSRLGGNTTKHLTSTNLSRIYEITRKMRVLDRDRAVRVLAGKTIATLEAKVLR